VRIFALTKGTLSIAQHDTPPPAHPILQKPGFLTHKSSDNIHAIAGYKLIHQSFNPGGSLHDNPLDTGPKTEASEFEVRPVKIENQEVRMAFGFYQTFHDIRYGACKNHWEPVNLVLLKSFRED
jgi:hypothetical protein